MLTYATSHDQSELIPQVQYLLCQEFNSILHGYKILDVYCDYKSISDSLHCNLSPEKLGIEPLWGFRTRGIRARQQRASNINGPLLHPSHRETHSGVDAGTGRASFERRIAQSMLHYATSVQVDISKQPRKRLAIVVT